MNDYKSFYKSEDKTFGIKGAPRKKGSANSSVHVALFSGFFCNLPDNFFCTNNMYAEFKENVVSAIEIYKPSVRLTIDLFESKPSSEEKREFALIGFRDYIRASYQKLWTQFLIQLITISALALLGVILEVTIYTIPLNLPAWILHCLDIMGTVLIWQFVGYWAFEFSGKHRELKQLKQLMGLEFSFRLWE